MVVSQKLREAATSLFPWGIAASRWAGLGILALAAAGCLMGPRAEDPGEKPMEMPRWDTVEAPERPFPWRSDSQEKVQDFAAEFPQYLSRGPGNEPPGAMKTSEPAEENAGPAAPTPAASTRAWAMFQGDAGHSGSASEEAPEVPLLLGWRNQTGLRLEASPVAAEGRVVVAARDGSVLALSSETGEEIWRTRVDAEVAAVPAAGRGCLFVPALDGNIYALRASNGDLRAKFKTLMPDGASGSRPAAISASPVVSGDFLYFAGHDGNLYQVALEDLTVRSRTPLGSPVSGGGFVVSGEVAMAACESGEVLAVSIGRDDGRPLWKAKVTNAGTEAFRVPVSLSGGNVLVATGRDAFLFARGAGDGRIRWAATLDGMVAAPPAADAERVFVSCLGTPKTVHVTALRADTGERLWRTLLPGSSIGAPLAAGGLVFVGISGPNYSLCALDGATGERLWEAREFSGIVAALASYRRGLVVITENSYVAAYEPAAALEENPWLLAGTPMPNPYVDWQGTVEEVQWRHAPWPAGPARVHYRLTDFLFQFHPEDDATPWTVVSKPMMPLEPFLLSPTYTGLVFPQQPAQQVRLIGVKGNDRPAEGFYDVRIPNRERVLTALIVARKIGESWRPIYVNNWFTSWRLNRPGASDPAIGGYYLDRGRPFEICMRIEKDTLPLLTVFDRAFVAQAPRTPVARGRLVRGPRPGELQLRVGHFWGQRPRAEEIHLQYGDPSRLMLLDLVP
ncbi:MAG: PQQ-binding-like beta-propeller repeat protein [Planctomycetes bacterium]|nr:PQQ-binding-like beta-propeller repeat protein [Planctomycetota bacterium]